MSNLETFASHKKLQPEAAFVRPSSFEVFAASMKRLSVRCYLHLFLFQKGPVADVLDIEVLVGSDVDEPYYQMFEWEHQVIGPVLRVAQRSLAA